MSNNFSSHGFFSQWLIKNDYHAQKNINALLNEKKIQCAMNKDNTYLVPDNIFSCNAVGIDFYL